MFENQIIYLIIIYSASLFAFISQHEYKGNKLNSEMIKFHPFFYIISFIILAFFCIFSKNGTDYLNYIDIFTKSSISEVNKSNIEPGFIILCSMVKWIVKNPEYGIAIIKLITLVIVYYVIYSFRNQIDLGLAVFAYCTVMYYQSFNVIRISLASAVFLLSLKFLIDNKVICALLISFIACTFHYSALYGVAYVIMYLILFRNNKIKHINILVIVFSLLIYFYIFPLSQLLTKRIVFLSKYSYYFNKGSVTGTGIYNIILLIIVSIYLYTALKRCKDRKIMDLSSIFCIAYFLAIWLSYKYFVAYRMSMYCNIIYIIFIPYFSFQIRIRNLIVDESNYYFSYGLNYFITFSFFILQQLFYFYINNIYLSDGLRIYNFIWG